jgi:hypothetical protein
VEHVECFHGCQPMGTRQSIFVQIFFYVAYCTDHRRPKCMQWVNHGQGCASWYRILMLPCLSWHTAFFGSKKNHSKQIKTQSVLRRLEGSARGDSHTWGTALRRIEGMRSKRFVLSVEDDTEFRSRKNHKNYWLVVSSVQCTFERWNKCAICPRGKDRKKIDPAQVITLTTPFIINRHKSRSRFLKNDIKPFFFVSVV